MPNTHPPLNMLQNSVYLEIIKLCYVVRQMPAMTHSSTNCALKNVLACSFHMKSTFWKVMFQVCPMCFEGRISLICDISGSRAFSHESRGTVISLTPTPGRPSYHWRPDNQEIMRVLGHSLAQTPLRPGLLLHKANPHFGPNRVMVIKILPSEKKNFQSSSFQ